MSNKSFRVKSNKRYKTFTLRVLDQKGKVESVYRTTRMSRAEFEECLFNTDKDWKNYLKTNNYLVIR